MKKASTKEKEKFKLTRTHIIVIAAILLIAIIVAIICIVKHEPDVLIGSNEVISDVYPEDVDSLYVAMDDVSCSGGLHFDIKLDDEKNLTDTIDRKGLLDYVFSYMDKNNMLSDEISMKFFNSNVNALIYSAPKLIESIKDYQYGDYVYNYHGGVITRKKSKKCTSDKQYVTRLYGYSYDELELAMDVSVGYLDNGILYSLEGVKLGAYDGDKSKLLSLFAPASYYRYYFVKSDGSYKLSSVEVVSKK